MSEAFLALSAADQRDALLFAASHSGRALHLLEKDIWVVWTLQMLYESPFGEHLVFKGGTSLSKAYAAIGRFSEDVDLTYDIRAIAPDLVAQTGDVHPPNRSQEQKWTKTIRARLSDWVRDQAHPLLASRAADLALPCEITSAGDKVYVSYNARATGTGYVAPRVILEFGARATGEPWEQRPITCYAHEQLKALEFPSAMARVMRPERTFWEKATAIHVFCRAGTFIGAERFSRHWYDLVGLDSHGYVDVALADRELAARVARHKNVFFREKDAAGALIDYEMAVAGHLHLIPDPDAIDALARDYAGMLEDGLIFDEPPTFEALLSRVSDIQRRANPVPPQA